MRHMRKNVKYRELEERKINGTILLPKAKKAVLLLGIALVLAGCGGQSEKSQGTGPTGGRADSENAAATVDEAGGENPGGAGEEKTQKAAPEEIYRSIENSMELPSMMEGDDDFISNYYGIEPADLDSYVFASAEDATLATSVIIMKAKSEDVVEKLEASLNTVIEQKAAEMQGYIPEQYDIVADSSVKTEGLYVYLVIAENAGDIEAVISAAVK